MGSLVLDLWFGIFGFDFRFQVSEFRCQISNLRFEISDLRFQISDCRLEVSDIRFHASDFRGLGEPLGQAGWGNQAGRPIAPAL